MKDDHVFYSALHPQEGQKKFILRGLDGVRALAVLLVLVYHLWPQALPGGMIGVDVFFVISGYLITALLLREGAYSGKMDIVSFWIRRLRRLLPAFTALILVLTPLTLLIGPDSQVGLGRQILGAFTYSSNWLLLGANQDYFTQTSPELLTNFWSLAVEEQFYFFWPVILVFLFMFTSQWKYRALLPASLALLSVLLAALLSLLGVPASRIYYGTDTHLFGLMLGVLLAMLIPWSMYPPVDARLYPILGYGQGLLGLARKSLGWLSLGLLIPLALNLSDHNPQLLLPWGLLAGSLLGLGIIQALLPDLQGPSSDLFRQLLSLPPLTWIGQRSYGIYLWHWPLLVLAHYAFGPNRSLWVTGGVFLLSFILAGLSFIYLEEPIRRLGFRRSFDRLLASLISPGRRLLPLALSLGTLLALLATIYAVRTAPSQTQAQAQVSAGAAYSASQNQQAPAAQQSPSSDQPTQSPAASPASLTLIGDSVTLASAQALAETLPQAQVNAEISRTSSAALPLVQQLADRGELGRILVLSVTANSTFTSQQLEDFLALATAQEGGKLVLVTGLGPAHLTWIEASNQLIRDFAAQHPDQVLVADWQAAAQGHPDYLVSDGVHPQGEGITVYAQTIQEAVARAQEGS